LKDELRIGKKMIVFSNRLHRTIGKEVAQFGITGVQSRILGFVCGESKSKDIFQKDIEEELDIRRSSVTSVLQLMEKNGFIKRESSCDDARLKKIVITEKGIETNNKVFDIINEIEKSLNDELTEDERKMFINLIDRLSKKVAD
jgi:DNA-binding MarR family transcriptional regulator